ncbi:hypothetical protein [Aeromonas veronii]|uniref:Uncharacterized protein n=1 Tax=Aeromonas veronii TaxID=654 RepID=A0A2T4MWR5_AERVE|nr:hypothetical protein [Aeromonas veronii]PTH79004.1 hypothetical protein DAA48_21435 [Aeromonas veronii]
MNFQEKNNEVNVHKEIRVPILLLLLFAVAFIGVFFAIYIFNSGRSSELSEISLIEKNIRNRIIQWTSSHEDKVSARASVLSYYQCIDSSAGFSDSDCLQITGDEDFIGTVVDAINKTEASQKVKNHFLVSPIN